MEAKELRIGNYIIGIPQSFEENKPEELICKFIGFDPFKKFIWVDSNSNTEHFEEFKPILLTDEWLLKFGFKKLPLEGTYFKMIHGYGREREDSLVYHNGIILSLCQITDTGRIISEMTKRLDINHVHQLQNLYFALTGEELTLKTE